MKKVVLSKVNIEGFRSIIDPFELDIDRPGITFIKGPNGVGKTSIIEAIVWCLYGSTLKGRSGKSVSTWEHLRPVSWKGTRVILELFVNNIPYTVARHIEYKGETEGYTGKNTLMVFKAGSLLDDLYKSDCQAAIEKLIEVNEDKFLNSIVFGQRVTRMMNSPQKDQKTFFSSLFDLDYIDQARARAATELKLVGKDLEGIDMQLENNRIKYEALLSGYSRYLKEVETFENQVEEDRRKLADMVNEEEENFKELLNAEAEAKSNLVSVPDYDTSDVSAIDLQISELDKEIKIVTIECSRLAYEMARKEQDLNKVKSQKIKDTCDVCGGKLKPEVRIAIDKDIKSQITWLEEKIQEYNSSLQEANKILAGYNTALNELKARRKELSTLFDEYMDAVNTNKKWEKAISKIEAELKSSKTTITRFNQMLLSLNDRKRPEFDMEAFDISKIDIESQSDALNNGRAIKQQLHDAISWWYKVGFSDSGLKFYIMNSMMDAFNKHLKYYSKVLGVGVQVKSDFTGIRKEFYMACNIGGYEVDYSDISGGQKQRVDLILTLALHDLISSKLVIFNCLFFDEAETGLDAKGMELFFELLRTKPDKSIYLITHRLESDYTGSNIIEL